MGLLFRETNVINGIMTCVEVLHDITKQQVEKLKNVDEVYLRKLLGAHSKVAKEALFIETGKIPINLILKVRRLMYWWHLINKDKETMLYKVYDAQNCIPVKGDWVNFLNSDNEKCCLIFDDETLKTKYKTKQSVKK